MNIPTNLSQSLLIFIAFEIFFIVLIVDCKAQKGSKNQSRFEIKYRECQKDLCKNRDYDESCVFRCISTSCFDKVYDDYLMEFGEVNNSRKTDFEACYTRENK